MIRNYFKVGFRSILKNRIFSLVNITGLAIGIAAFQLIIQYVHFELSYDRFIPEVENIYRVTLEQYQNNDLITASAENYPAVGPAMLEEIPEVESYARLYNMGYKNNLVITYEDAPGEPVKFKHRKFLYADSSFLPMFGYEMIQGDAATALEEPMSAVISEKYARMYFGDEDPLGKMLRLQDDDFNNELCKVTGVFKDLPENTHLKFDVLFSYKTLPGRHERAPARYEQSWQRKDMYTYVKLRTGTPPEAVEGKLPLLLDKYSPELTQNNRKDILRLQPVSQIHLYSSLADEPEANGNGRNVYSLALIAFFILVMAWVNYINLATSKALERSKEVGVRKSVGASRNQLMKQFLVESAVLNLLAVILSFGIAALAIPLFNDMSGMSLTFVKLFQPWFIGACVLVWLMGSLLSGVYPAFFLSSFQPANVLKGSSRTAGKGRFLRRSLVVFQFVSSMALIAGTVIIYNQLSYMMTRDIGMDISQVLVVERPGVAPRDRQAFSSAVDVFRDEVLKSSAIQKVSSSVTIPGKKREYKTGVKKFGKGDADVVTLRVNSMDHHFIDVFDMELLAGRAFSPDFVSDPDTSVILTESAAQLLGFSSPDEAVGHTLAVPAFDWNPIVVGVVNDYHQEALQKAKDPIMFYCTLYGGEFYSMKLGTNNLDRAIQHVEVSWEKAFPGNPFGFFFLDDYFNRQYQNEKQFATLAASFAAIAVIVGCLGLFGLSAYTAQQRTKEIGIRKVLGSSTNGIFLLLSKDFIKLILVAVVIAVPITWYGMEQWLNNFAYREKITVWTFLLTGAVVVFTAIVTVSFQTVRAARVNPVESLRQE